MKLRRLLEREIALFPDIRVFMLMVMWQLK